MRNAAQIMLRQMVENGADKPNGLAWRNSGLRFLSEKSYLSDKSSREDTAETENMCYAKRIT